MLLHSAGESVGIFVSAAMIRQNDPQPLVELFTDPRLNRPGRLRRLQGRVRFRFGLSEPGPFYAVPELRTFLQTWHRAAPNWFFFADLNEPVPLGMTLGCLPTLTVSSHDNQPDNAVAFNTREMLEFLAPEFLSLEKLGRRAGFTTEHLRQHGQRVWSYCGLPPQFFPLARWPRLS